MASKTSTRNVIAILVMLLISIAGGFITEQLLSNYRKGEYPREYPELVEEYAFDCRIPEWAVYASMKLRSGFNASLRSDDGKTGLFQLTDEQYYLLSDPADALDPGLLYDPGINIKLGCRWISSLYERYGSWDAVWAAMYAGEETVDGWLTPAKDGSGMVLKSIPDKDTAAYAEKMTKIIEKYKKLYEEKAVTTAAAEESK